MGKDFDWENIIHKKSIKDKRQKKITLITIIVCICSIVFIMFSISNKNLIINAKNEKLKEKDLRNSLLIDSIKIVKLQNSVECYAIKRNMKKNDGKMLYDIYFKINNNFNLDSVGYFFNHKDYSPNLKISKDSTNNFYLHYIGWGFLSNVKILFYHKNYIIDTINFPQYDKVYFVKDTNDMNLKGIPL